MGKPDALLHHSNRRSQYTSEQFQRLIADHSVLCSMSRSGNVWDNAAMESLFSSLKTERTARKLYRTRDEAKADVFDYIRAFLQSETQALQDRISGSHGVREASWISNRVSSKPGAGHQVFLFGCHNAIETLIEGRPRLVSAVVNPVNRRSAPDINDDGIGPRLDRDWIASFGTREIPDQGKSTGAVCSWREPGRNTARSDAQPMPVNKRRGRAVGDGLPARIEAVRRVGCALKRIRPTMPNWASDHLPQLEADHSNQEDANQYRYEQTATVLLSGFDTHRIRIPSGRHRRFPGGMMCIYRVRGQAEAYDSD
jgi:hypothetical protein